MKTYFIERKIEKIEVYEVEARNCDEAKMLIDEDKNNGKLVDNMATKTLRNVSGLYKEGVLRYDNKRTVWMGN